MASVCNHEGVTVYGEATVAKFAKKHAASRKPLQRFLAIASAAEWPHFPAVKGSFPGTDYRGKIHSFRN